MRTIKKIFLALSIAILTISILLPLTIVKGQTEPLFKVTIIAPGNANMVRRQWGQIFANSLKLLGIDARVVFLGWASVFDRVLTPDPSMVGKTYDEGGYDMLLIGWTPGLIPEPRQIYYGGEDFLAPYGQNYYLWQNATADALLDAFITSTNITEQEILLKQWQQIYFEDMPASQIMYQSAPAVVNPVLTNWYETPGGEGWLYFNAQPYPELLKGKSTVVYCSTGEIESLIPPLSNSWYDTIIFTPIFNGLAQVWPDLSDLSVPALLTDWAPSADGFKWTFHCRTGVKWHDGENFTADDVVFSLWALMNPQTGSQFVGYYQSVYGDNVRFTYSNGTSVTLGTGTRQGNITAVDEYTVEVELPELALGKPYGYFDPYLLSFANNIIPKHIFENIPPAQWTNTPFNTGQGSIVVNGKTYTGPVGTGPYKWVSYDPVTQLVHLEKFDDYWNKTGLEALGAFEVEDYYIKFIADKTAALAALKNGEVDILDPNYQMQVDIPSIDPSWGRVLLQEGTGRQEIGYNMRHPVFGTGTATPLGQADPSRAAEAARYVRIAFDYAIPRQLIIDNLLSGFGEPGATPMLPTQPFYNDEIAPREYSLAKAKEYLEKAGYSVPALPSQPTLPSFTLGMSTVISGIYVGTDGNPVPNRELQLMVTTDNSTYATTSIMIGRTVTGLDGWYSFTVTPTSTGVFYYYLFDREAPAGEEWKYVQMLNVTSLEDLFETLNAKIDDLQSSLSNTRNMTYAAIAIAVVLGLAAFVIARRKR
ncbi:MAG: ABC transporter substrate-binding protein [Candidatus Bathyarchaeia archaeon]